MSQYKERQFKRKRREHHHRDVNKYRKRKKIYRVKSRSPDTNLTRIFHVKTKAGPSRIKYLLSRYGEAAERIKV